MAGPRQPRKKKAAPRAADDLQRPSVAGDPRRPSPAADLRRQAEEQLDGLSTAAAPAPEDAAAIVHELRVHQTELEVQNEELRRAQFELEAQREKYFELFDLAPVGYLALDAAGIARDANLTAARLLGVERQQLVGQPFSAFVLAADRDAHYLHQRMLQKTGEPQTCELRLQSVSVEPFWGRLEWRLQRAANGEPLRYHLTFTDVHHRVVAEEALRESEAKYRRIVETAVEGIIVLDSDARMTLVNQRMASRLGYTIEEMVGRRFEAFLAAEELADHRAQMMIRAQGEDAIYERCFRRKDGGESWALISAKAIVDPTGASHGSFATLTDITARKRAEAEVARTLSLLESTMESTADGLLVVDGKGGIVRSNVRFREMWGVPEAIIAAHDDDAALSFVLDRLKEPAVFLKTVRDLYGAPEETSFDVLELRDGRVLERYSQPQRIGDAVVGRVWSFHDVTARKQAEEELRETRDYLDNLLGHANAPIIVWDAEQRITRFNRAFEELTGRSAEEVVGEHLGLLFPEDARRAGTLEHVTQASAGERWRVVEIPILRADGEVRTVLWNSATLYADDGATPVATIAQGQDITERKRAEQALLRLNEDLVDETAALAEANATITRIAATDHLTGLANRRHFYEALEKAVSLARRHRYPLALVSLDLDGLKQVNDSAGHAAGDEVLTSFAALLAALCRAEDLPGRLGGDEFSVLLPGNELGGARGLAERVLAAVRASAALAQRGVTVSAGVAQWAPDELPDDLLRRADEALYAAKRDGGAAVAGAA